MKITHIEVLRDFDDGALGHKISALVRVGTDSGIVGCAFSRNDPREFLEEARQALIGKSPHALEEHIQNGLLHWASIEHALWDLIGKEAGLPIHKLLGGFQERLPVYLTCVWAGSDDQSHVPAEKAAEQAVAYMELGFKAMKIRSWRPDPMDDVAVVRAMEEAVGDRMDIMVDRTATVLDRSGTLAPPIAWPGHWKRLAPPGWRSRSCAARSMKQRGSTRSSTYPSPAVKVTTSWRCSGSI